MTAVLERSAVDVLRAPRRARRRRYTAVVIVLGAAVVAAALASLSLGELQVSVVDVLRTLAGHGTSLTDYLVDSRLPRVGAALVAGAALGVSGGLLQCLLRNPLASPDLLGITGGAGVATIAGSVFLGLSGAAQSALAFVGALAVAALVYALAWRDGITGPRFVLVGIGVAFMVTALLGYVLTRADISQAQVALAALVGGVGNTDTVTDVAGGAALVIVLAGVVPGVRGLQVLQLGADTATGLGVAVGRRRAVLVVAAVLLAAVGVGVAGPLTFVAFLAAPVARRLVRGGSPALLPAALVGALVVQVADLVGQHWVPGGAQLPAGVLTGVIGAPYLLWQLATGARDGAR